MPPAANRPRPIAIELNAVLVALIDEDPQVLTLEDGALLPSGPFEGDHPTLQTGLRAWVERQTHHPLGYVEQLYTFADRSRAAATSGRRIVSISYLGLTRERVTPGGHEPGWQSWYRYFPWEDWRDGTPAVLSRQVMPRLKRWTDAASDLAARRSRRQRMEINFAEAAWNEDLVLQRYELLYEAGLVPEAGGRRPIADALPGVPMHYDHRRILATGIARLRAKIKYRPVVFELMPPDFTLGQLQLAVEALAGRPLHKQNFRRLIDQQGLVEETGAVSAETGGRPAKLYRFRREILLERAVAGSKLPLSRAT
ncbi:MAG: NUDIX hydrolase [Reyranella sp.]